MAENKALQIKKTPELAKLAETVDLSAWANSLVNGVEYHEPDPDYLSRKLLMQTLTATTPEQVFEGTGIDGLQKMIPDMPDAGTGPIIISEIYVARSSLEQGTKTYVILTFTKMSTGETFTTTTGAQQVQAQLLKLASFGNYPVKCQIKRTDRKDRGGRFLFWVFPSD